MRIQVLRIQFLVFVSFGYSCPTFRVSFRDATGPGGTWSNPETVHIQQLRFGERLAPSLHRARLRGHEARAYHAFNEVSNSMPKRRQLEEPQEPIGIVISGGLHEEPTPKLTAYVYSIEDETSGEPIDTKAA